MITTPSLGRSGPVRPEKRHAFPLPIARLLQRELDALGLKIGLSTAKQVTAHLYGYPTYREIEQSIGRQQSSQWDAIPPDAVAAERRSHHLRVLEGLGLTSMQAASVIDRLKPTASSTIVDENHPVLVMFRESLANGSMSVGMTVKGQYLVNPYTSSRIKLEDTHGSGEWTISSLFEELGVFRNEPQDGRFVYPFKYLGHEITALVSILDGTMGVASLRRPVDRRQFNAIADLGLTDADRWRQAASRESGICLIGGSTHSGKTTTVLATIRELSASGRRVHDLTNCVCKSETISRLEDEFRGVTGAVIGFTDVRSKEAARFVFNLAKRGNMVIASLHSASVWATVHRLMDEYFSLTELEVQSNVRAIAYQDLLRRPCISCEGAGAPDKACHQCLGSGHAGHVLVSDVAVMSGPENWASMRLGIEQSQELVRDGLRKVADGLTTVQEIEWHFTAGSPLQQVFPALGLEERTSPR
jgi:hypothetical protein